MSFEEWRKLGRVGSLFGAASSLPVEGYGMGFQISCQGFEPYF